MALTARWHSRRTVTCYSHGMTTDSKRCTHCSAVKSLSAFYRGGSCLDGHQSWCITCTNAARQAKRAAFRQSPVEPPERKRCPRCHETFRSSEFYGNPSAPDGLQGYCKACTAERLRIRSSARIHSDPSTIERACTACGIVKSGNQFFRNRHTRDGIDARCKSCKKVRNIQVKYGLGSDAHEAILLAQDGRCGCCKKTRPLCVDHDHETNKVRGLLCQPCNLAIGLLGDSVTGVRSALMYLTPDQAKEGS